MGRYVDPTTLELPSRDSVGVLLFGGLMLGCWIKAYFAAGIEGQGWKALGWFILGCFWGAGSLASFLGN